ncbi:helix-turn-helix domain-containing protein [Aestuariispira insulae]|uniref:Excisionase family DNA binding protein n=1 Tax=Aestuariispira insulae TaxID=1461337 RepID=A0A3D9HTE9_9PROT|nr:helix-turn-helix domain-containing protein [Aestuariispira insulae]RED52156.1 excisionase family DNA binding protein [Aestuariispira insulae]
MLSKPMLTLHEVAELLKIKESTIRSWINNGQLRAYKFGREWRVAQKDLESYIQSHASDQPGGADGSTTSQD